MAACMPYVSVGTPNFYALHKRLRHSVHWSNSVMEDDARQCDEHACDLSTVGV